MSGNSTMYVPLRDEDHSSRSLSVNERIFLRSSATANDTNTSSGSTILRMDGRSAGESRPIRLLFSRSHNFSECTAIAASSSSFSSTQVSCTVHCELIPCPRPLDRPNDGILRFIVDCSPMASIGFDYTSAVSTDVEATVTSVSSSSSSQRLLCNRILRNLERNILIGGAMDVESLCVVSGKWVWRLIASVTVMDHGGNCLDLAMLCTMAALRHYRRPQVDTSALRDNPNITSSLSLEEVDEEQLHPSPPYTSSVKNASVAIVHSDDREPSPLSIFHTPLLISFALFADPTASSTTVAALLDPSHREESVQDGTITFGYNKQEEITCFDFPGGCEMHSRQIFACAKLAFRRSIDLCDILEVALREADEKANQDRLVRLRDKGRNGNKIIPPVSSHIPIQVPFVEATDSNRGDEEWMHVGDIDQVLAVGSALALASTSATAISENVGATAMTISTHDEEEIYRIQALDYATGHIAVKIKEKNTKNSTTVSERKGSMFTGSLMEAMMKSATNSTSPTATGLVSQITTSDPMYELELVSKRGGHGTIHSVIESERASSSRTTEADIEFCRFVSNASLNPSNIIVAPKERLSQSSLKADADSMAVDSDEEEGTVTLRSEFDYINTK